MGFNIETYDGQGNLVSSTDTRTPAEVVAELQDSVTDYRDNILLGENACVWFNGYYYDFNLEARNNLNSTISYILLGQTLPSNFTWRDFYNNNVPQNNQSISEFYLLGCEYSEEIYAASWTIKGNIAAIAQQAIDTATILSQLDSFDITSGWPANDLTPTVAHAY